MPTNDPIRVAASCFLFLLSACATQEQQPERYLLVQGTVPHSHSRFVICSRAGCEETARIQLRGSDWQSIHSLFMPPAVDSDTERKQIAEAIALMEQLVSSQAGTQDDQPAGQGVFRGTRQLDCVAETTNTTVYLVLMRNQGLLKWHRVGYPEHRGVFHLLAPHNTAVLIENDTNRRFAVDAYYHANGQQPEIVPLDTWSRGYKPEGS